MIDNNQKKSVLEAYLFLRENNQSIPDDILDLIKDSPDIINQLQQRIDELEAHIECLMNPTDEQLSHAAEVVENSAVAWEGFSMLDAKCCYQAVVGERSFQGSSRKAKK